MDERAEKYRSREKRKGKEISYFTGFGYCPYCRKPYHRKMNKGVEMLYCASNRERSLWPMQRKRVRLRRAPKAHHPPARQEAQSQRERAESGAEKHLPR